MVNSDRTKLQLAAALKERTRTTPLSKIRVAELCAACGIERRTFYCHFHDLYELVAWTFNRAVDECLPGKHGNPGLKGYEQALTRIQQDAWFFRRALSEDSQNSLGRYIVAHDAKLYEQELQRIQNSPEISLKDRVAIQYHCFGHLGMLYRWLQNDCTPSAAEMAALLVACMPPIILRIYTL